MGKSINWTDMIFYGLLLMVMSWSCSDMPNNLSAPTSPSNPNPADGEANASINTVLSWECADPDGDYLTYDIYFGDVSPPPFRVASIRQNSYDLDQLPNGHYFWKILAEDSEGNNTGGPIWSFSVSNQPPDAPVYISPADGEENIGIDFLLTWQCADPDSDDLVYDVYLGTSPEPPLFGSASSESSYLSAWKRQDECGELLQQIYSMQEAYRLEYDTYCLSGATASRYDPNGFATLDIEIPPSNWHSYTMTAGQNTFICTATANIDLDATIDTWTITQNGQLVVTINDLDGSFLYNTTYFWKIIARDPLHQESPGPIWHFISAPQ
jgi:hypothetical protein